MAPSPGGATIDAAIRRLRSEARQLTRGKEPTGIRYPDRFRAAVVTVARTRRATGHSVTLLAKVLGVSTATLTRWVERPARPRLRPVTIEPAPRPEPERLSSAVLVTPHGVRVEGLDHAGLVAVLRALQ